MYKFILTIALICALASNAQSCDFEDVAFKANFEQGALHKCEQVSDKEYTLYIKPEDERINPSPWYAFIVHAKANMTLQLNLVAENARPRYLPKKSYDQKNWSPLAFEISDNLMRISLITSDEPVMVAGQPIINNTYYKSWATELSKSANLKQVSLGQSVENRPITALIHQKPANKEWLLLIGRQHPPELTGAQAFLAFSEAMFKSHINQSFLERFNVLIVPNMNPDGVARGHWRHNVNGIDLNRDWGKFTQAETKAVQGFITKIVDAGEKIVFALDFHSTQQDIFYTMPSDYALAPALFSEEFLADLKPKLVSSFTLRQRPGSSPGRGVFKQYLADEFSIHSITYEMGDNTPIYMVNHVAQEAAILLQDKMLDTTPDEFIYTPK